ncbi:MAG: hypothetical protein C4525_01330 [Desulfarculus sp.]|jgi:hypothetical protein|nr:MAG: hypothetical protein C4525_01330 [Desulfarculus sp.]
MSDDPLWTRCLHLPAGTCPELARLGLALGGESPRRPELNQDLALQQLGLACQGCNLKPQEREQA